MKQKARLRGNPQPSPSVPEQPKLLHVVLKDLSMALDLGCYRSETKETPKPLKYPRSILQSHRENTNMEKKSEATLSNGPVFREECPVQGSPLRGHCSLQTRLSYKPFELQKNPTILSQVQESRLGERRENMCRIGKAFGGKQPALGWQNPSSLIFMLSSWQALQKEGVQDLDWSCVPCDSILTH